MKVGFFDRRIFDSFLKISAGVSTALSTCLLFLDFPEGCEVPAFLVFLLVLFLIYLSVWIWANRLKSVHIKIDGTTVIIKAGDLFKQNGLKAVAFNEYFDTKVDDRIISEGSLNGKFIQSYLQTDVEELDREIDEFRFEEDEVLGEVEGRQAGKTKRFRLGTVYVHECFLLTAMSRFDDSNRANLTMPEYLEFLIRFWDRVNKVYAQRSVSTPIFGSGITRIKGHKNISDEDLLKIMLWTFRISEMRFKFPAKLTIVIHEDKIDQVNLLDMKNLRNGV